MHPFIIISILISLGIKNGPDTEKIVWSDSYKLQWSDFKGTPQKGIGYVANTNSGVSFSYSYGYKNDELILDYHVESRFYPESSWYIPSEVDSTILRHEQTHFDISEIHARILRRTISETSFSRDVKNELETIYTRIENKRRNMQYAFDRETDHSRKRPEELEWENDVSNKLQELSNWE